MANRRLTKHELELVDWLLAEIRGRIASLAGDDPELLFAYRRKLYKQLVYDERGTPASRNKAKDRQWAVQGGLCAICQQPLPEKYTVLDRTEAYKGYVPGNVRLIHDTCDRKAQKEKGYA